VRIVTIGQQQFYQVRLGWQPQLVYLSTQNGRRLSRGDELYARWIARQFLEGGAAQPKTHPLLASLPDAAPQQEADDCCKNATTAVLDDTSGTKITEVQLVEQFDNEYKYINRLLPVYKVRFERKDGIRIYVETGQDRFAFAMDNRRAVFDRLFTLFHTLGWLDILGSYKHVAELLIMVMAFCTTLMGIYIFFSTKTKKSNGNNMLRARRNHRWTSIIASLFTLMFTFSGGYHAFSKITPDDTGGYWVQPGFRPGEVPLNIARLQSALGAGSRLYNIGLVRLDDTIYWQVYRLPPITASGQTPEKDLMKSMSAPAPAVVYIRAGDNSPLLQGEEKYACYLASVFSKQASRTMTGSTLITKFGGEYGFVNKRLPVWKISYAVNSHERYYVETATGRLAARIDDGDLVEGYSFALLHKHEFMAWAGKPVKDFSTMFWAAMQVAMIVVGLVLYVKSRKTAKRQR
jgi:hypothetical protein